MSRVMCIKRALLCALAFRHYACRTGSNRCKHNSQNSNQLETSNAIAKGRTSNETEPTDCKQNTRETSHATSSPIMSSRRPASQLASHVSPLLSTRPSDSGLHVHLHPIVLLTITDHLTRYVARGFNSQPNPPPIIGALLGRQGGELARDTTLEQGFECKVVQDAAGAWTLDTEWFEVRLQQCELLMSCCDGGTFGYEYLELKKYMPQ